MQSGLSLLLSETIVLKISSNAVNYDSSSVKFHDEKHSPIGSLFNDQDCHAVVANANTRFMKV